MNRRFFSPFSKRNLTYFGHVLGSVDTPDRYIMIGETTGTVGRRRHRKEIEEWTWLEMDVAAESTRQTEYTGAIWHIKGCHVTTWHDMTWHTDHSRDVDRPIHELQACAAGGTLRFDGRSTVNQRSLRSNWRRNSSLAADPLATVTPTYLFI